MNPKTKIISTFIFILAISLSGNPIEALAISALLIPAILISKTTPSQILSTLRKGAPYLIFIILMPKEKAILTLIKSLASLTALALITKTTSHKDLINGLKSLGTPKTITTMLSFFITYMHTFRDTLARMTTARTARSFSKSQTLDIKDASNQLGCLIVRNFDRSEHIYDAMLARGWQGE